MINIKWGVCIQTPILRSDPFIFNNYLTFLVFIYIFIYFMYLFIIIFYTFIDFSVIFDVPHLPLCGNISKSKMLRHE